MQLYLRPEPARGDEGGEEAVDGHRHRHLKKYLDCLLYFVIFCDIVWFDKNSSAVQFELHADHRFETFGDTISMFTQLRFNFKVSATSPSHHHNALHLKYAFCNLVHRAPPSRRRWRASCCFRSSRSRLAPPPSLRIAWSKRI